MEKKIRSAFAGIWNGFQTHRPVLCEAVLRVTDGPILELGAGDGSTAALHEVSRLMKRTVITLDHDPTWVGRYTHLRSENHAVVHVASWEALDNPIVRGLPYGVAFVDHAPAARRIVDIKWLARQAKVVVVHDTESPDYGFSDSTIWNLFKYKITYRKHTPWTSALSNFVDVAKWKFSD